MLPTAMPGAWNGVIVHTDTPFPMMSTTEKKWNRFKAGISWILSEGRTARSLSTVELWKIAGLGVNVMQVYANAKPYLKGMFNALEAFRVDQDSVGWQTDVSVDSTKLLECSVKTSQDSPLDVQDDYPVLTPVTLELLLHAKALQILFKGELPLMVPVQPTYKRKLCFFVRDAS